ncbi:hypothetical protein JCM31826_19970 [Thermaurantimonas aggregans]|uniref:Uncharacterized protein n=1 Tax=Thermaurantimonas aggregans TaxID=2173829 RepID=A0A401XND6_9FLAO|nr:hypothetical protein [Thermaurantimonas aggregans]MCX8149633.1 hypothetical protein [Thermaurantimonas aggregans]GCD78515.1 hypothetical protein JCM31826_19970 [Thermaurantimonas aggregans]
MIHRKNLIKISFFLIFCCFYFISYLNGQSILYLEFPEYGFKHKFPSGYSTFSSSKLGSTFPFVKGYSYYRQSGQSGVDIIMEIYKGDCLDPNLVLQQFEKNLRNSGNSNITFSDVKSEMYISPFGWLILKGTARSFGSNNYYHFYNLYISKDYIVAVHSYVKNDGYWDEGYGTLADKSDGSAFVPLPVKRNLSALGMSLRMQGFFVLLPISGDLTGYEFIRCSDNLTADPLFRIFLYEGNVKKRHEARVFELLAAKSQLLAFGTDSISWNAEGKRKFSRGSRSYYKYMNTFSDGKSLPLFEVYYTFTFKGKPYLVQMILPLKKELLLRGYQESNFDLEYVGRETLHWYEQGLIEILETIE